MVDHPNPYEPQPSKLARAGFLFRGVMGALIGGVMAIAVATALDNSEFNSILLVPLLITGFIVGAVNRHCIAVGIFVCALTLLGWSYFLNFGQIEYGGLIIVASLLSGLLLGSIIGGIWAFVRVGFGDSDDKFYGTMK